MCISSIFLQCLYSRVLFQYMCHQFITYHMPLQNCAICNNIVWAHIFDHLFSKIVVNLENYCILHYSCWVHCSYFSRYSLYFYIYLNLVPVKGFNWGLDKVLIFSSETSKKVCAYRKSLNVQTLVSKFQITQV